MSENDSLEFNIVGEKKKCQKVPVFLKLVKMPGVVRGRGSSVGFSAPG